ncbi:type 1 glutamine amidotransferase [Nocardioides sp. NPDC101246]|uniref:type 1 glutamine amidotransferase n=1 Tax=Nocardioides sp. NPDC101246 TaxID=3364336 RepID=UPI0038024A90
MSIAVISHHPEPQIAVLRAGAEAAGRELTHYAGNLGQLPERDAHEAWVVLGGAKSAYADQADFHDEIKALRGAVESDVPVLAICLGSQLLSVALGGRACPGESGLEAGLIEVEAHAVDDARVPSGTYFSFHSDTMEPPTEATILARTDRYLQAWSYGSALAVQFHPELDVAGFEAVLDAEEAKLERFGIDVASLRADVSRPMPTPTAGECLVGTWLRGLPTP